MILPRNVFTLKHVLSVRIMACLWHGSFDSGYKFFVLVLESSFISIFRQLIQALSSIIELSLQSFPLISNFVSMKVHAWTSNQDNWFKSSHLLNVVYAPPHKKNAPKSNFRSLKHVSNPIMFPGISLRKILVFRFFLDETLFLLSWCCLSNGWHMGGN